MANEYSINAKITADSSDFQKAVKDASKSLEGMKDAFGKATQNIKRSCADWGLDIDRFYNKGSQIFKDFGIDIDKFAAHFGTSGKVIAGITAATVALTKFGQVMNEARGELAKGTGAVGEDLIKLQDTFHKAMIEGIGRDAKEVGGMMADLNTRFGATEKELVNMTVQFDKFSAVMGVDTRQAINDTADVMAKWGIETKDLNPLLDQLTTASQMSGATISELTSGLKQGQAVFSQFGMSATDSIAILSSLAKNGIETNSAITALKYSLNVFSKAGIDAKTGLNDTIEAISNAKTETEALSVACEVFGARNGVEMVKVLKSGSMSADEFKTALMNAGGALNATDEASRTSIDAISDLKATLTGTFAGFGEGFDSLFKDIIDSVSETVRFLSPVIEPIGNIFRDVFSAIGEMLKVLVDNFIEFQKKYNDVFKAVAVTVQSAYKVIHLVLGNVLEVFKTSFSLIFAILDGKWGLAWENAKKLALLFAKNLSDILSGIVNLFAKMINGVIEKLNSAIDLYHKLPKAAQIFDISNIGKISESNNLADSWGITSLLEETEKRIEELSGKAAEKITGDLGEVKEVTTEINTGIEIQAMKVSQVVIDWSSKLTAQQISLLEKRRDEAIETAKLEKKNESEIFAIKQDFNKKIIALQTEQIEAQRKADIKKIEASKETLAEQKIIIAQINQYYDNQLILIQKNERLKVDEAKKSIKGMAESWDFYFADLKKRLEEDANDWTDVYKNIEDTVKGVATETLMSMGEALAGNGEAYEDFGATATKALSEVLKGLAAQLSALAAVNAATFNYGKAALAAAGAAAALVAAGTLKAVSNGLKKVDDTAKSANISLDEFVKRIQNIKDTSFSKLGTFDKGVIEYSTALSEAIKKSEEAYEEYYRLRNELPAVSERFAKLYYSDLLKKIENAYNTYKSWSEKVVQGNKDLVNSFINLAKSSQNIVKENSAISHSYQELFKSINEVAKLKSTYKEDWFKYMILMGSGDPTETKFFQYQKYSVYLETLTNNIKAQVQDMANEVYESMLSVGKDIGETFVSSIVDGVKKEDFMLSIKDYMKKQMTKLVVLTDEFSDKIAGLGLKLISAMTSEDSKEPFEEIKNELSSLYDEAETKAKAVESVLTEVFGEVKESTGEASSSIAEATLSIAELKAQMADLYKGRTTFKIAKDNSFLGFHIIFKKNQLKEAIDSQKEAIEEVIRSYYESLKTVGSSMAGIISSGFKEGLSKEDLKLSIKEWIRNQLIESTVYEVYQKKLAKIGAEIAGYMTHGQANYLGQVSKQIDSIYDGMTKTLQSIDSVLDQTFGVKMEESAESVEEELEKIEESYTKFEKSMKDFSDTISDLGGDIASNLIDGLSNGLSQSDFLTNMKNWIKKMLVQSVVYTEQMKSQIEEIGKAISSAISGGFTETSMHEIRRDLSFIFEQATSKMSGIDKILGGVFDGYASGTTSALSGLHIVGERGPELVKFNGGERVYNNADTMRMIAGAGKTNNFNVTFNNLQDTSAFAMMNQLKQYNREMAINGVI